MVFTPNITTNLAITYTNILLCDPGGFEYNLCDMRVLGKIILKFPSFR